MVAVGGEMNTPGGIFQFIPNNINATNGSVVTFQFSGTYASPTFTSQVPAHADMIAAVYSPGNHSITQSAFSSPCEPLAGGFDSGWVFISANTTPLPEWNITITNDQTRMFPFLAAGAFLEGLFFFLAIWFFCKQLLPSPHCNAGTNLPNLILYTKLEKN